MRLNPITHGEGGHNGPRQIQLLIAPLFMKILIWNFATFRKIYQSIRKCKNNNFLLYYVQGVSNFSRPPFSKKNIFQKKYSLCQILLAYRNRLLKIAICAKFQLYRSKNEQIRANWKVGPTRQYLSLMMP